MHGDERVPIVQSYITRMTNIPIHDINIVDYDTFLYTNQNDGNSCGYFTCLYAEAWLFNNRNMLFQDFNINTEKRRILWHLNNLFTGDNFEYHPRTQYPIEHVVPDEGVVVNNEPFVFLEPDPPSKNLRRSERIRARKSATPAPTIRPPAPTPVASQVSSSSTPIGRLCTRRHKGFPCADVRSKHTADYYDSGNFGDSICYYCGALLLNSEVHKAHKSTYKRISSSFCCKSGKVTIPSYTSHPDFLVNLLKNNSKESKEFLKNQNLYNSLLAFASVSVGHEDSSLDGSVCFMLNGEFSRRLSSMFSGHLTPSFSQLYILDANEALNLRTQNTQYGGDRVDPSTLEKLDQLLRETHPFAKTYKNFHTQYEDTLQRDGPDSVKHFRLTLVEERDAPAKIRDPSLHTRQVNLPDEISMFSITTESDDPKLKGIYITDLAGSLFELPSYHPMTDTLCYPLLFPNGDDGYHKNYKFNRIEGRSSDHIYYSNDSCSDDELDETTTKKTSPFTTFGVQAVASVKNLSLTTQLVSMLR
ncbi:hypothetical protein ACQ4LE_001090 [Meloidogyne hapla]